MELVTALNSNTHDVAGMGLPEPRSVGATVPEAPYLPLAHLQHDDISATQADSTVWSVGGQMSELMTYENWASCIKQSSIKQACFKLHRIHIEVCCLPQVSERHTYTKVALIFYILKQTLCVLQNPGFVP